MKDPIDSRQLHIFLTLARKGSLRLAAQELHITNSAISHSIHVLEENLGVKLFHRPGKYLILTESGHYLTNEAADILQHMDRVRIRLTGPLLDEHATFKVAAGFNFVNRLLPDVMREWQQCFPKATLAARAAERDACLQLLKTDAIDAAVLVNPPEDPELEQVLLFEDELRLVVSSGNPLARAETITLRSLHQKVLVVSRLQSHSTQVVLSEMRRGGFSFRESIEVGSGQALCEMIKAGAGIAFIPEWLLPPESGNGSLVARRLEDARFNRRWSYVRRKHAPANLMNRTFLRLCQLVSAPLVSEAIGA
jgi:LysR family transcriptional regulator for metE and metH